jgi:abortive infection bacteriophage resistance protein
MVKKRSTSTLSIELQSIISRALDNDDFALVSSIDLSFAFDVVNLYLLLKRLRIIGLPPDCIELIEVWLKNRCFYVSIDNTNSALFDLLLGTVQGSVLGPILNAIFVSPIFDIVPLLTFADDSYITVITKNKEDLKKNMEKTLEDITKWLKKIKTKVQQ